jgi:hypothetical protein
MENTNKSNKPLEPSSETESWIFSLTPIGVAFVFYIMFIISTDIESKGLFIAYGAAAGFIGLESYWIVRGWRKKRTSTVVMGILGIAITLGLLKAYVSLT